MRKIEILWVDDEINYLKPHILFLKEKGYEIETINNGDDAIDLIMQKDYDLIFLDEQMPGLSGIETLEIIKNKYPELPVIMITKSEEENIMEEAIGSKISDYLIKPVKPNQILLSIKKVIDHKKLINQKTSSAYQQEFRKIGMQLSGRLDYEEWVDMYKKLVYWELELNKSENDEMYGILEMQKKEANQLFGKFVKENYPDWINNPDKDTPTLSHNLVKRKILPYLSDNKPCFVFLIDNLRYDQWNVLKPVFSEYYNIDDEDLYLSILPTATHYSRNALFAGLMPTDIENKYPKLWVNENEDDGKNKHEEELLKELLLRLGKSCKSSYHKILNLNAGKQLANNINDLMHNDINVIVYNFVDMISHARTEMEMIRELADNDAAYRSITLSWFKHSALLDMIKQISEKDVNVIITTDHGSIMVQDPVKVIGDKNSSSNLRYKQGRNLKYDGKNTWELKNPADARLPKQNISTSYIFASNEDYFVYPNNYNHFAQYFRNTFQHGGVSLEEMMIPIISLKPKTL